MQDEQENNKNLGILSLGIFVIFLIGVFYYLLNQEFFRPINAENVKNNFNIGVFLALLFLIIFLFSRVVQLLFEVLLKSKTEFLSRKIVNKLLKPKVNFVLTLTIVILVGLKIFGFLDVFVLISIVALLILILWLLK